MKKHLFFVVFLVSFLMFSGEAKAQQTLREPVSSSQKSDDGALIAYPNPTRDFIIVKAKNPSLKVVNVTFYSIIGTQVSETNVNSNSAEIRLDRLKPGKYLMRYTSVSYTHIDVYKRQSKTFDDGFVIVQPTVLCSGF